LRERQFGSSHRWRDCDRYLAAKNYQQLQTQPTARAPASFDRVQLKTGGNIRRDPSTKAPVVRVAQQGDILRQFGKANGWVQVGRDTVEGWLAESTVNHLNEAQ
jgi:SH3 domain-containing protein